MKYLLLKHYRGGPKPVHDLPPMDRWTPEEVDAHVRFMRDFAARLEETGEFVDTQALTPGGTARPATASGRSLGLRRLRSQPFGEVTFDHCARVAPHLECRDAPSMARMSHA